MLVDKPHTGKPHEGKDLQPIAVVVGNAEQLGIRIKRDHAAFSLPGNALPKNGLVRGDKR
jgi:hypothetical protein